MKRRVAQILNITSDHIPDEWPICPHYMLRSPQRNRAVSWLMAILVTSCTQSQRELTLQEYIDILKMSQWKLSMTATQRRGVGTVYKRWISPPRVNNVLTQTHRCEVLLTPPNRKSPNQPCDSQATIHLNDCDM
jgi:hypothetical protein